MIGGGLYGLAAFLVAVLAPPPPAAVPWPTAPAGRSGPGETATPWYKALAKMLVRTAFPFMKGKI